MLAFPQWNKSFYVEVDASTTGVGAVLSQKGTATNKLRPICYYSSSLSPSQKSYSAGQLEAWALVSAARKWLVFLRAASEVIFLTDHCPLQWMRSQKDPRHTYRAMDFRTGVVAIQSGISSGKFESNGRLPQPNPSP